MAVKIHPHGNIQHVSHKDYMKQASACSVYFYPVTIDEIQYYLKSLKNSAAGYDEVSPEMLKLTAEYISTPLTHIINLCFRQGYFPDKRKIAKVIPVFKSGGKGDVNNYRPISVLPSLSKIFEKAIAETNSISRIFQPAIKQSIWILQK